MILHNTNSKHSIILLIQGLYEESLGVLLTKDQRHNSNIDLHINIFTNDYFKVFKMQMLTIYKNDFTIA